MFDYSARPELLKDRVILVTGAGRGIGAAAAKTFAAHGATVLLLGKTEANLTQVYDEIEAAGHPQPVVIPFNLETALPHQYDELAAMVEAEFGHLDGLLHNASIIGPRTPLEQLSGENFMRVMQVNVNAMFMLTSTLLPLLKLSQDASVVFTSSSVGRKGRAYWGAYGVSKFATEGLMQTLADEVDGVAPVRANSVNPGATRTSMRAQAYPGKIRATTRPPRRSCRSTCTSWVRTVAGSTARHSTPSNPFFGRGGIPSRRSFLRRPLPSHRQTNAALGHAKPRHCQPTI